jgi:hypothetical protein
LIQNKIESVTAIVMMMPMPAVKDSASVPSFSICFLALKFLRKKNFVSAKIVTIKVTRITNFAGCGKGCKIDNESKNQRPQNEKIAVM